MRPAPLALLLSTLVLSGSGTALAEDDYFAQLPVVLSASRLAQPLAEAPGSMTVIDQALIRASGARKLTELLRLIPGFQVGDPGQDPARVTYHGLAELFPPRLQVLVDGRSLYSPLFFGGVNWDLIPVALEDIERIEVLRGPNSAAYGANAFLGVVNIVTVAPASVRGVRASVSTGGNGTSDRFVSWAGGNATLDLRASYGEQREDGMRDIPDRYRGRLADLSAELHLGLHDTIALSVGEVRATSQLGRPDSLCSPLVEPEGRSTHVQLGWTREFDAQDRLNLTYRYTDDGFASVQHAECDGIPLTMDLGGRAQYQELEAQHTFAMDADTRVVWGGTWQQQRIHAPLYYADTGYRQRQTGRLFGNLEWRLTPDWLLNLGGSWERERNDDSRLAPRISLHHHFTPHQTLRLGASQAYRPPSLSDATAVWLWRSDDGRMTVPHYIADPGVDAERIDALELGYLGEWHALGLSLDTRLFSEHIPNRIQYGPRPLAGAPWCPDERPCALAEYAANAEDVRIRGVEYQLRWQPETRTRVLLNQAYLHIRSRPDDGQFHESAWAAERRQAQTEHSAPQLTTTLFVAHDFTEHWTVSATHYRVGAMQWTSNSRIDAYDRTDLRLARRFRWGSHNGEIAYSGHAIDGSYAEYRSSRKVEPLHFITLSFGL